MLCRSSIGRGVSNLGCPDKIGSTSSNKVSLEEVFFSDFHGTKNKLKRMQHVARGRVSRLNEQNPEKEHLGEL